MQTSTTIQQPDAEAVALAACYRLLLQKAQQRRARLAAQADAAAKSEPTHQAEWIVTQTTGEESTRAN